MKYLLSIITFCIVSLLASLNANAQDTLWVHTEKEKPYFTHKFSNGESIFKLGKWYNVPLATIADLNDKKYKAGFKSGDAVVIPIDKGNYSTDYTGTLKPLYYKVSNNENLMIISKFMGVRPSLIQEWNNLPTSTIRNGDVLLVGWIKYKSE